MPTRAAADTTTATFTNGVRAVAIAMPWRRTVSLSVFIRTGSLHEPRRLAGISHVVEHMAFKGTHARSCQQINLDAEMLGAEVNAHTDKDHTAFHVEGLHSDLPAFVAMLADVVRNGSFPADELERERQVLLQEFAEVADDPVAIAFQLFDRACYGWHPAGQPVIGRRATIERITRDELLAYAARQYTAGNVIVATAGAIDAEAFFTAADRAFGGMPAGADNTVAPPAWQGGVKLRRLAGSTQCQLVLGFAARALPDAGHAADLLAAAVLGEGMSSPLLDQLRERRGLAYHVSCNADVAPLAGELVIDAATAPGDAAEVLAETARLLREHAAGIGPGDLLRARNQLVVRQLRAHEQATRRLEAAAQELFALGRVRGAAETIDALQAVTALDVQAVFQRSLSSRPALALAGGVPARLREHAAGWFEGLA